MESIATTQTAPFWERSGFHRSSQMSVSAAQAQHFVYLCDYLAVLLNALGYGQWITRGGSPSASTPHKQVPLHSGSSLVPLTRDRLMTIIRLAAILVLLLTLSTRLVSQDRPVAADGTQVATEETLAAATNDRGTEKTVAEPHSQPHQRSVSGKLEFQYRSSRPHSECFEPPASDSVQRVEKVEPHHPLDHADRLRTTSRAPATRVPVAKDRSVRLGRPEPSFFLSPKTSKVTWGVGPTLVLPTATNTTYLGQGKLSIGPSFAALVQPSHFTIGFLVNNYWSVAGHSNKDKPTVNQFLLEWFVNFNMKKGWYLKSAPINTANWRAAGNTGVWTVPLGGGVGRIMKIGSQPVNVSAEFYGNAVHPAGTSPWTMRLTYTLLFPNLAKK